MNTDLNNWVTARTMPITKCIDQGAQTIQAATIRINREPDAGHLLEMLGLS